MPFQRIFKTCALICLIQYTLYSRVVVEDGEKFFYLDEDSRMSLKVVNHSLVVGIQKDVVGAVILGFGKSERE